MWMIAVLCRRRFDDRLRWCLDWIMQPWPVDLPARHRMLIVRIPQVMLSRHALLRTHHEANPRMLLASLEVRKALDHFPKIGQR